MIATFVRYWGPCCAYAGVIFYLSSLSHPEQELPSFVLFVSDKALHAVEYAILAVLCYRAFRRGSTAALAERAVLLAIVVASLYGISDEVHQAYVPFRNSSWKDWVADTMGAVIGVLTIDRFLSVPRVNSSSQALRPR